MTRAHPSSPSASTQKTIQSKTSKILGQAAAKVGLSPSKNKTGHGQRTSSVNKDARLSSAPYEKPERVSHRSDTPTPTTPTPSPAPLTEHSADRRPQPEDAQTASDGAEDYDDDDDMEIADQTVTLDSAYKRTREYQEEAPSFDGDSFNDYTHATPADLAADCHMQINSHLSQCLQLIQQIDEFACYGPGVQTEFQNTTSQLAQQVGHAILNRSFNKLDDEIAKVNDSIRTLGQAITHLTEKIDGHQKTTDKRLTQLEEQAARPATHTQPAPAHHPLPTQEPALPKTQATTPRAKPKGNPLKAQHPTRLLIKLDKNDTSIIRPDPEDLIQSINKELGRYPESAHLHVVAARVNANGCYILNTRMDQTGAELAKHQARFLHLFSANASAQEDKKWLKVLAGPVTVGRHLTHDGKPLTDDMLHERFARDNPVYAAANVVMKPRFIRTLEELAHVQASSVVFAVDNKEDYDKLMATGVLAAWSRYAKLTPFSSRPPVTQCKRCWSFSHDTKKCQNEPRCRLCGEEEHDETVHRESCQTCETAMDPEMTCTHNLRCVNCEGEESFGHSSDSRRCPQRLRLYGSARNHEKSKSKPKGKKAPKTQQGDGWTTVPTKTQNKSKATPDRTNINAHASENRFAPLADNTDKHDSFIRAASALGIRMDDPDERARIMRLLDQMKESYATSA